MISISNLWWKKIPLPFEKSPLLFKWRGDFPPANPNPRLDTGALSQVNLRKMSDIRLQPYHQGRANELKQGLSLKGFPQSYNSYVHD